MSANEQEMSEGEKSYPVSKREAEYLIDEAENLIKYRKKDMCAFGILGPILLIIVGALAAWIIASEGIRRTLLVLIPMFVAASVMIYGAFRSYWRIEGLKKVIYNLEVQIHLMN